MIDGHVHDDDAVKEKIILSSEYRLNHDITKSTDIRALHIKIMFTINYKE